MYLYIDNVPKHLKVGEYGRAISYAFNALDAIYIANTNSKERYNALSKYLMYINSVRSRIRLFGELHYLSVKQTTYLCLIIDKVTKQATGWRNSSQHARSVELRQDGNACTRG